MDYGENILQCHNKHILDVENQYALWEIDEQPIRSEDVGRPCDRMIGPRDHKTPCDFLYGVS